MIKETRSFYVECDRCKDIFAHNERAIFITEQDVVEHLCDEGWTEHEGKHYCPECYEIDEDTDFIFIKE
ncbi:MAG: hypothetical protein LBT50_01135 [Prevotellaceae bacterium]|jgi:hypothetical protein|nr:hypothetical protein [Prevotellaceae bacterium]